MFLITWYDLRLNKKCLCLKKVDKKCKKKVVKKGKMYYNETYKREKERKGHYNTRKSS